MDAASRRLADLAVGVQPGEFAALRGNQVAAQSQVRSPGVAAATPAAAVVVVPERK